jgi:hypothetical protein
MPGHQIVLDRVNAMDVLCPSGELEDMQAADIEHMLATYQDDVDRVFAGMYPQDAAAQ